MNEITNYITEVSKNYQLTQEEYNTVLTKYQNDTRNLLTIKPEIENLCKYFMCQNKLNNAIRNAPNLEAGKNYYVAAFDKNSNIYLQPVSVSLTNSETNEVIVENTFKGYQKHTGVDNIEIAICQIGKLLNIDIVEEYELYNINRQRDSIIIRDIINDNEFYDVENLKKRFLKLINNGKLRKEKWVEDCEQLKVANSKEDYKLIIDYGLNILKSLPSMVEEDFQKIEQKYLEMILFDCIINQSERNFKDYGILCDKETKRYKYAPLFDNVFPTILKNNDIISLNGITCNRYELMECLCYNYYDKIKDKLNEIIQNKDNYLQNIDIILKYNLDLENYTMILNNIITNLKYLERLNNEKTLSQNNNNAGYVNAVQMILGLGIIIIFSVCIAYLLYSIN